MNERKILLIAPDLCGEAGVSLLQLVDDARTIRDEFLELVLKGVSVTYQITDVGILRFNLICEELKASVVLQKYTGLHGIFQDILEA